MEKAGHMVHKHTQTTAAAGAATATATDWRGPKKAHIISMWRAMRDVVKQHTLPRKGRPRIDSLIHHHLSGACFTSMSICVMCLGCVSYLASGSLFDTTPPPPPKMSKNSAPACRLMCVFLNYAPGRNSTAVDDDVAVTFY